jgi:hypothetical protein
MQMEYEIRDGYFLTGRCDLYDPETATIEDYKTATVWKITNGDFDEWRLQGLMYAWLARKTGKYVERIRFHAMLKDWSASGKTYSGPGYPEHPIYTYEKQVTPTDMKEIEEYIRTRFDEIIKYENASFYPLCTNAERWNEGDKFAVMKEGRKSALKLFDGPDEANTYRLGAGPGAYVEKRIGEDKKCLHYCDACRFCDYFKSKYGGLKK